LSKALAEGKFIPAPGPLIARKGLKSIEKALGIVRDRVSARRVVVSLLTKNCVKGAVEYI
jgi:hypothetical protein